MCECLLQKNSGMILFPSVAMRSLCVLPIRGPFNHEHMKQSSSSLKKNSIHVLFFLAVRCAASSYYITFKAADLSAVTIIIKSFKRCNYANNQMLKSIIPCGAMPTY